MKKFIKRFLAYRPLEETSDVRRSLAAVRNPNFPFCPDWEGDFIWSVITTHKLRKSLETGFGTGSTALYMLSATGGGEVTSIDWSATQFNEIGKRLLEQTNAKSHTLIEEPSERALSRLYIEGRAFDFAYLDGWKTFDHLALETYIVNRMLKDGGVLMFDDTRMPSVNKIARMLVSHYNYQEIAYTDHNENWRLRLWHILTTRSLRRPYRAFLKATRVEDQPAFKDYRFFRRF
jgi:predicted O-methyltransferase YrrM